MNMAITDAFSLKPHLVANFLYDTEGLYEQDLDDHRVMAGEHLLGREMEEEGAAPYREFWRFPKDFQRTLIFQFTAPDDYLDTPTLRIIYDTLDEEAGDIRVTAEVLANSDGEDMEAAEYDTANAATDTVEATAGETNLLEFALTNADSMAAKDIVLIRLTRTPAHADDTLEADMRLFEIDFCYNDTQGS